MRSWEHSLILLVITGESRKYRSRFYLGFLTTGGPDLEYIMLLANKRMYENALKIALNATCRNKLNKWPK